MKRRTGEDICPTAENGAYCLDYVSLRALRKILADFPIGFFGVYRIFGGMKKDYRRDVRSQGCVDPELRAVPNAVMRDYLDRLGFTEEAIATLWARKRGIPIDDGDGDAEEKREEEKDDEIQEDQIADDEGDTDDMQQG